MLPYPCRLGEGTLDDMVDGVHLSPVALAKATQMVLNLVCNDNMNFNDGSCCKSSDRYGTFVHEQVPYLMFDAKVQYLSRRHNVVIYLR